MSFQIYIPYVLCANCSCLLFTFSCFVLLEYLYVLVSVLVMLKLFPPFFFFLELPNMLLENLGYIRILYVMLIQYLLV